MTAACLWVAANSLAATHVFYWGDNSSSKTNVPAAATNIVSVTGGDDHILGLRADGAVFGWGLNSFGAPVVPAGITNAVAIAAGSSHSLTLMDDGTVRFWGSVYSSGVKTLPPELGGEVVALAVGPSAQNILAMRADNTLVDCGNPSYGLTNVPASATNITGMAVGSYYAAVLRGDGKVVTWGQFYPWGAPTPPFNLTNVVAISGGIDHILALKSDGKLVEWGSAFSTPSGATNIATIACGGRHNLALRADGKLFAWGNNGYGQLNIPPGLSNIVSIAATTWGNLVLTADDGPPLLGRTLLNPAVLGTTARLQVTAISTTPLSYQWFFNGTELGEGTNATLVLTNMQFHQAGSYSVIVSNRFGTATNADLNLAVVPAGITVQPLSQTALVGGSVSFNVAAISQAPLEYQWRLNGIDLLGATNSLLTLTNLQLNDAGLYSVSVSNTFGEVVSANAALSIVPLLITAAPQDQFSFPGGTVTVSITVQCNIPLTYQWQFEGSPLDGATASSLTMTNLQYTQAGHYSVLVTTALTNVTSSLLVNITPIAQFGRNWNNMGSMPWGLANVLAVANGNAHTLALKDDGSVVGWGSMAGTIPPGLTNVAAIAAGEEHSLALNADGTVVTWGGLLTPPGLSNIVAVASGSHHALALKSDGTVVAWGSNSYGQTNVPAGLTNVVAIAGGEWHSLALSANGVVTAWGAGAGNTGSPNYGQSMVPRGLNNVLAIAACSEFSLALREDGTVVGWGENFSGQTNPPVGLSNVVSIAAGWGLGLALRRDGTVVAWGDNSYGQTNVPAGLANVGAIFGSDGPYGVALVGEAPPTLQRAIISPSFGAGGFMFSFPSQSGRVYLIEYKNTLAESNWTPLPLLAGNGHLVTLIDPSATGDRRFYRIRRW